MLKTLQLIRSTVPKVQRLAALQVEWAPKGVL
jgi:hypothetical protein